MLTFLGDVALIGSSAHSSYKPETPYIFNCEYVIGDNSTLTPVPGKINLCGSDNDYIKLFGKNPIAVTLTNNHINDFGTDGFIMTKTILESKGISVIDNAPFYYENYGIISFMDLSTSNSADEYIRFSKKKADKFIKEAKEKGARNIIALMHWGIENDPNPVKSQIDNAHWLIDHGIDLIIGHHPHCVQSVENYKGKLIFYSLGNGVFPPINQPSHYNVFGKPTRTYRFNWCKWNRISYAVTVNNEAQVTSIHKLYQTKKNVVLDNGKVELQDLLRKKKIPSIVYLLRKYWLFFVSNTFVDGKIIDLGAVKAELKNG